MPVEELSPPPTDLTPSVNWVAVYRLLIHMKRALDEQRRQSEPPPAAGAAPASSSAPAPDHSGGSDVSD
ncbi:MAG: hypothetical protein K8J31_14730 [Anaerolineae bacterium]|nr:hypothetical protein [Anaerolineae bacterium]